MLALQCQGQHWKAHKLECRRLEDDVQRTGTAPVGTSSTGRQQTGERAQEEEGPAVLDVPNARRRVLGIRCARSLNGHHPPPTPSPHPPHTHSLPGQQLACIIIRS